MGLGADDLEKYHDRSRSSEHNLVHLVSLLQSVEALILIEKSPREDPHNSTWSVTEPMSASSGGLSACCIAEISMAGP
jgi:hypothetical protein